MWGPLQQFCVPQDSELRRATLGQVSVTLCSTDAMLMIQMKVEDTSLSHTQTQ